MTNSVSAPVAPGANLPTSLDGGMMPGVQIIELLAMVGSLYPAPPDLGGAIDIAQLGGLEKRRVDRVRLA
jgi:hypothetical protein